jgi:Fe-S-cluster-containing dehydrogenase component
MARYGMLINTKKCVGCYACRVACQMVNGLESDEAFIKFDEMEQGVYPNVYAEVVPVQCMHCEDAPCEAVCPTHATYTTDSGVVLVDEERCIGCKYCMAACPYQVRTRNSKTGEVDKCRFCTLSSYENGTKMCSCVDACLTGARIFGDLDDSDSEISKEIARTGAAPIAGDLTRAKIYYVR